jgi:hypothetical protein
MNATQSVMNATGSVINDIWRLIVLPVRECSQKELDALFYSGEHILNPEHYSKRKGHITEITKKEKL